MLPPEVLASVGAALLPGGASRICEVNSKRGHTIPASLLRAWPAAAFVGLSFAPPGANHSVGLDGLPAGRARLEVGDRLRTVRSTTALTDCDVLALDLSEGSRDALGGRRKEASRVVADLPNALQRVASGVNLLLLHGPSCAEAGSRAGARKLVGWCAAWAELIERRLVVPWAGASAGCVVGTEGERWCVGRVDTSSACIARPPLLGTRRRVQPRRRDLPSRAPLGGAMLGVSSAEVEGLKLGSSWRYFTLLPCAGEAGDAGRAVCLIFKNHVFESWVGGLVSLDGGRSFVAAAPSLVMPTTWPVARMTHNLAIAAVPAGEGGGFIAVGGQYKLAGAARCGRRRGNLVPCKPGPLPPYDGVWMVRGASWRFGGASDVSTSLSAEALAARAAGPTQWREARRLFNGTHPGCVERRSRYWASQAYLGTCEFDGRLSLVQHSGRLWLYARANPALHGQRFVQATSSADGGLTWSPFSFINLRGYGYAQGDLYFFVVAPNPVVPGTLLALFPIAHKFRGCIAISASADALSWSEPTPLLSCAVHGERAVHHPAQGFVREGRHVAIFVHENVPGVTTDDPNIKLAAHPYLQLPRPRLVRHTVPADELRSWSQMALRSISNTR